MDMIGYTANSDILSVLLETDIKNKPFLDTFAKAATSYTQNLNLVYSFNPFGSDHMPYIKKNIPAILTIDNDYDKYPAYHRTSDKPTLLSKDMALQILKMNVATLALFLEE